MEKIMEDLCIRQGERWNDWEVSTLDTLSAYYIPQHVIGRILLRTRKAIERKKYHLKESREII